MEVVCLILPPTLTSRPCSHAFLVLTCLHFIENFFYYSCSFPKFCEHRHTHTQYDYPTLLPMLCGEDNEYLLLELEVILLVF